MSEQLGQKRDGDEEEKDEGIKKNVAVGNQERVATTTGCVFNQQQREILKLCRDEVKQVIKRKRVGL